MNRDETANGYPFLWVRVRSESDLPGDFPEIKPEGIPQFAADEVLSESGYDQLLKEIFQSESIIVT